MPVAQSVPQSYSAPIRPAESVPTIIPPNPDTNPYVAPQSLIDLNNKAQGNMSAASDVINNQLTGKAYDPYALQTQQALGRAEANQRAKTASMIHSSGFSGTPLGASAGNAVESDLLRNRFDTNLGIEAARQDMMNTGVGNAMNFGTLTSRLQDDDLSRATNRFALDKSKYDFEDGKIDTEMRRDADRFALGEAKNNVALANLSDGMASHPGWVDAVSFGMGGAKDYAGVQALRSDVMFNKAMQDAWAASGGAGQYTDDFAFDQLNAWKNTTNNEIVAKRAFKEMGLGDDAANLLYDAIRTNTLESLGVKLEKVTMTGDDGEEKEILQFKRTSDVEKAVYNRGVDDPIKSESAKTILADPSSGEYKHVINDIKEKINAGDLTLPNVLSNSELTSENKAAIIEAMKPKTDSLGTAKRDGSGYRVFTDYEEAFKNRDKGAVVWINGRPARVVGNEKQTSGWANEWKRYTLEFLDADGGTGTVRTSDDDKSKSYNTAILETKK
jgi:hypothetical protein